MILKWCTFLICDQLKREIEVFILKNWSLIDTTPERCSGIKTLCRGFFYWIRCVIARLQNFNLCIVLSVFPVSVKLWGGFLKNCRCKENCLFMKPQL